jgi:hypothetical protein
MLNHPAVRGLAVRLPKGSKYGDLANYIGKFRRVGLAENGSIGKIYLNALSIWHSVNPQADTDRPVATLAG